MSETPLPREFFARDAPIVARDLIGKRLVRIWDNTKLVGRIVEAEGYRGTDDAASHAYRGRTARNYLMFGPPGYAYVYFIYGMHWMFNITAHPPGAVGAVLIRALEPERGIDIMRQNRGGKERIHISNGPSKLAQAMGIDGTLNGLDLCQGSTIYVTDGWLAADEEILAGPRVRVPGDERSKARPWRFWIKGNPYIST